MARFTPNPGMDVDIANQVLAPVLRRAQHNVVEGAQRHAPAVGVWVTARDERVRPSHVDTDGQTVPENLRFQLPSQHGTGYDLAQAPRDPDLPIGQRIACRCHVAPLPRALADSIHDEPLEVLGTRVLGKVVTSFPRAAEAEVGNTTGDEGARFMRSGLNEAAARMRETVARGT